jgi:hypothetical protein
MGYILMALINLGIYNSPILYSIKLICLHPK